MKVTIVGSSEDGIDSFNHTQYHTSTWPYLITFTTTVSYQRTPSTSSCVLIFHPALLYFEKWLIYILTSLNRLSVYQTLTKKNQQNDKLALKFDVEINN